MRNDERRNILGTHVWQEGDAGMFKQLWVDFRFVWVDVEADAVEFA